MHTISTTFTVTDPALVLQIATLINDAKRPAPLASDADSSDRAPPPSLQLETASEPGARPFQTNDIELPHGEILWHKYKGVDLYAEIVDGRIKVGDEFFDSLSAAADAAGKSVDPACNAPNGYKWWAKKNSAGKWVSLEVMRLA